MINLDTCLFNQSVIKVSSEEDRRISAERTLMWVKLNTKQQISVKRVSVGEKNWMGGAPVQENWIKRDVWSEGMWR